MSFGDRLSLETALWLSVAVREKVSENAMAGRGTLEIDARQEESWATVEVTDSGSGIPEDIRDRIFEPFFTTKPSGEGSGLGLDIVKKIINKHKGAIAVESVPGKTTFTVRLPLDTQQPDDLN